MKTQLVLIISLVAINAAWGSPAVACLIRPSTSQLAPPTQAEIDRTAKRNYENADFIAQVTVLRSPRFRRNTDRSDPPAGLLRVDAAVKGSPPRFIRVPLADPCLLYFQTVGERVVVSSRNGYPSTLADVTIASLRRMKLGDWRNVP